MKLKSDAKIEEKLTCCFENDMRNFANFDQSTRKCQNRNFDKILLSKVENVWASNLQWNYVSWQWRMIQKLKRNWLVVLKLIWPSQILTRALEKSNFFFNWLLVTKVYFVWATKVQRYYLSWHWRLMQIWRKTDLWLGKWHEEFCKFSPEHLKVSKLEFWWDPFIQSRKGTTLKFTEALCHDNEG